MKDIQMRERLGHTALEHSRLQYNEMGSECNIPMIVVDIFDVSINLAENVTF